MLYCIYISILDIILTDRGKKVRRKGIWEFVNLTPKKGPVFTGPFPFSAYVDPGQYGIEGVFQGYFVVCAPVFVAENGLPFDQALDAVPEFT